ncbi:MAG: VOC family protein [Actinoallomurus sp.]
MIINVNTVTLYVGDQQAACDFYVDLLGFEVHRDTAMGSAGGWRWRRRAGRPRSFWPPPRISAGRPVSTSPST